MKLFTTLLGFLAVASAKEAPKRVLYPNWATKRWDHFDMATQLLSSNFHEGNITELEDLMNVSALDLNDREKRNRWVRDAGDFIEFHQFSGASQDDHVDGVFSSFQDWCRRKSYLDEDHPHYREDMYLTDVPSPKVVENLAKLLAKFDMMLNWVTTLEYAYDLALGSEVFDGPEGGVELLVLECLASKKPLGFSFDEEQRLKQLNKWTERYDDKKRADLPTFTLRLFHILDVKDPDNQKRETPSEVGSVLIEHFFEKYVDSTSPRHDGVQLEYVNCDKEPERCEDPKQGHAEL